MPTRILLAVWMLAFFCLRPAVAVAQEQPKDVYKNVDAGKDPQAFTDIVKMYGETGGDICEDAIQKTTVAIIAGHLPESDEVMRWLPALRPCAERERTQHAMGRWVELSAAILAARGKGGAPEDLERANASYKKGDFKAAASAYRRVLAAMPGHLDARNNLGLAELHAGNDVAAQLHLETLQRFDPAYVPALTNLAVVYERLGLRSRGGDVARQALVKQKDFPPAIFNAAWFAHVEGDLDEAEQLLATLLPMKANPIHAQLAAIVERLQSKEKAAILWLEDFDGPQHGWPTVPSGQNYDTVFESGTYLLNTKNDKCSMENVQPELVLPENYDVELRSIWKSGVKNSSYGLALGTDRDSAYFFYVAGNGQSTVVDTDKNAPDPVDWVAGTARRGDGQTANRQTVQVRGKRVQYLVNGRPIVAFENRHALSGKYWIVGVKVCNAQKVAFDKLRIMQR